ncbi:Uncharacterised protein [uncultured archaeon]|nr:Uncharacterised protein [uncultured archaeon]
MKFSEILPQRKTLFIDLDGVLVYLDEAIANFNHFSSAEYEAKSWDEREKYFENVRYHANIQEFFADANWQPNGKRLIRWLKENQIDFSILTKPMRKPWMFDCVRGKEDWVKRNGLDGIPLYFSRHKEKYAIAVDGESNILVDDWDKNISVWCKKGGTGILYDYRNFDKALQEIKYLYAMD